jgi:hypothetical protein
MAAAGSEAAELAGSSLSGAQVLDLLADRAKQRRTPAAAKYSCDVCVLGSPWLRLCEWAVERLYPAADSSEQGVLVSAFCHAFADGTATQYLTAFRVFAEYCCDHDPELPCLPASREAVHLFVASQARLGSVSASSLACSVSAIKGVHNLLGLAVPVVADAQHRLFMSGLGRILVPMAPSAERQPILACMLQRALTAVVPLRSGSGSATAHIVQLPVVTVLLGMLTGLRGSALASLTIGDLQVNSSNIVLRAQVLKRRLQPRTFSDWVIPLHLGADRGPNRDDLWRRVFRLLHEHCFARRTWAADRPLLAPLGSSRRQLAESFVDEQVSSFVQRYGGDESAAGFTSHSLRIGAVSAMMAAGVSRETIRVWLKWKSAGMIDLYARVVPCDADVQSLYQWMMTAGAAITLYV